MTLTKRMARMAAWIEANPYTVYGDYNDVLSDKQAQMIVSGDFVAFDESWFEVEMNASAYVDWSDWESEFVAAFYPNHDDISFDALPEGIKELALENRTVDCSELLRVSCKNWRGNVCARIKKRDGEYVEFPTSGSDPQEAGKLQSYLNRTFVIDGRKAEATYSGTYLTLLGKVDLLDLYQSQAKPTKVRISKSDFLIGHEPYNGSGTCGDTDYHGKPIVRDALFFVDGFAGYGVDDIFGLSGKCWANKIEVVA